MKHIILLIICFFGLISCKKSKETEAFGNIVFRLTDSPGEFEHVYLDIDKIEINHSEKGWITISDAMNGNIDILAYNNGSDTLISNSTLPAGTFTQIRLILGANNSLVKNGITYPLTVPSGSQSGIKININQVLNANQNVIRWIDFDAGKSIKQLGNGTYQLKPQYRSYSEEENGRIDGYLFPANAQAYVNLISNNDTLIAIPESNGYFKFTGLNGTYNAEMIPTSATYNAAYYPNIQVSPGTIYSLGIITLQ